MFQENGHFSAEDYLFSNCLVDVIVLLDYLNFDRNIEEIVQLIFSIFQLTDNFYLKNLTKLYQNIICR